MEAAGNAIIENSVKLKRLNQKELEHDRLPTLANPKARGYFNEILKNSSRLSDGSGPLGGPEGYFTYCGPIADAFASYRRFYIRHLEDRYRNNPEDRERIVELALKEIKFFENHTREYVMLRLAIVNCSSAYIRLIDEASVGSGYIRNRPIRNEAKFFISNILLESTYVQLYTKDDRLMMLKSLKSNIKNLASILDQDEKKQIVLQAIGYHDKLPREQSLLYNEILSELSR